VVDLGVAWVGTFGELGLDFALIPAGNSKLIGVTGSEVGTVFEGLIFKEPTLEADAEDVIPFPAASESARGSLRGWGSRASPSLRAVGGDVDVNVRGAFGLAVVEDGPALLAGDGVGCWI
jgi:hypothetical protein